MTSVLSFFLLCTRKHKNGKTKIGFRFIILPFNYKQTHKTEKRKSTSLLSFLGVWKNRHKKRKNISRLPFSRFSFYEGSNTKNGKMILDFRFRCHLGQPTIYVVAHALRETNATLTGPESAVGLFRRTGWSVSERTTGLLATTHWSKSPKILRTRFLRFWLINSLGALFAVQDQFFFQRRKERNYIAKICGQSMRLYYW